MNARIKIWLLCAVLFSVLTGLGCKHAVAMGEKLEKSAVSVSEWEQVGKLKLRYHILPRLEFKGTFVPLMTRLNDGRILFSEMEPLGWVQIFNPATWTFEKPVKMPLPVTHASTYVLKDGRVLFIGGSVSRVDLESKPEIYNNLKVFHNFDGFKVLAQIYAFIPTENRFTLFYTLDYYRSSDWFPMTLTLSDRTFILVSPATATYNSEIITINQDQVTTEKRKYPFHTVRPVLLDQNTYFLLGATRVVNDWRKALGYVFDIRTLESKPVENEPKIFNDFSRGTGPVSTEPIFKMGNGQVIIGEIALILEGWEKGRRYGMDVYSPTQNRFLSPIELSTYSDNKSFFPMTIQLDANHLLGIVGYKKLRENPSDRIVNDYAAYFLYDHRTGKIAEKRKIFPAVFPYNWIKLDDHHVLLSTHTYLAILEYYLEE